MNKQDREIAKALKEGARFVADEPWSVKVFCLDGQFFSIGPSGYRWGICITEAIKKDWVLFTLLNSTDVIKALLSRIEELERCNHTHDDD